MTPIYPINPLVDERWQVLSNEHPDASAFHSREWLEALQRTYGYAPIAFTMSPPGSPITDAVVFCRITSWLTGSRLVSLPFSDHCQPLVSSPESLAVLLFGLQEQRRRNGWKYIELRPTLFAGPTFESTQQYSSGDRFYFHRLNLSPDLDNLFRDFHKSCVQRKIRKAERENLSYESGRSNVLLSKFYQLLVLTRRRHQLPPQPFVWFENLIECLGKRLTIRVVSKDNHPIASILTIAHRQSLIYKYGCSDEKYHNLGGMPFLFWRTIQEAKEAGFSELDLGRSELDNSGLVQFKGHLGASCSDLIYYRSPERSAENPVRSLGARATRYVFSRLPNTLLIPAGKLLYRHLG